MSAELPAHTEEKAKLAAWQSLVFRALRLWCELLAVAALLLLTAVLVWQGTPSGRVLPMLGSLAKEVSLAHEISDRRSARPMHCGEEILLAGVSYRYQESREDVLHGISIRIPHGSMVGFVGDSGSRPASREKSPFLSILSHSCGEWCPVSGRFFASF